MVQTCSRGCFGAEATGFPLASVRVATGDWTLQAGFEKPLGLRNTLGP